MVTFTTRRSKAELVAPSRPTPHETKLLSDMDDCQHHYECTPVVSFFRSAGRIPKDTAKAIRAALAEALVYYYPVAGRLRELPGGKLAVDCTEEGVVFIEAEADILLAELGEPLLPPFPCDGELVCNNVGDVGAVLGKPLFFMQVTTFKCGGFAIGLHMIHCIADGFGWCQFMKAVTDIARGETAPLILPVWERALLTARLPPSTGCAYRAFRPLIEGSGIDDVLHSTPLGSMAHRCFFFGPREIATLDKHVCQGKHGLTPEYASSTVDLLASLHGRRLVFDGVFVVSDVTHFGGDGLDFGWGEWVGSGVVGPTLASFHMRCKNADSEEPVAVSMVLPTAMMERFENELAIWLNRDEEKVTMLSVVE